MKNFKRAITYGTFDLFHIGHLRLLERISKLADELVVAVSTDEFNAIKGKKCTVSFEHRAEIVKALRVVDKVIPENNWEQKEKDIAEHNCDLFVMGSDWTGKFDFLKDHCTVVYLERTEGVSSTEIKSTISKG